MTTREKLIADLARIVGAGHVLTAERDTRGYTRGFRYGSGRWPPWSAPAASSSSGAC